MPVEVTLGPPAPAPAPSEVARVQLERLDDRRARQITGERSRGSQPEVWTYIEGENRYYLYYDADATLTEDIWRIEEGGLTPESSIRRFAATSVDRLAGLSLFDTDGGYYIVDGVQEGYTAEVEFRLSVGATLTIAEHIGDEFRWAVADEEQRRLYRIREDAKILGMLQRRVAQLGETLGQIDELDEALQIEAGGGPVHDPVYVTEMLRIEKTAERLGEYGLDETQRNLAVRLVESENLHIRDIVRIVDNL